MSHPIVPPSGEYALRAMCCLAAEPEGTWLTSREIADRANVPPAFLAKVLRRLVQANILDGQKGHHGGFRLSRPASSIRVLDVLEAVDVDLTHDSCAFGYSACDAASPCPLHEMYGALKQMCRTWARANTLADIDPTKIHGPTSPPAP